jgi:hypothetical protein
VFQSDIANPDATVLKEYLDNVGASNLMNPLIFDFKVNHEHLQEANVDSSLVAAGAEPPKTETWPPTRGNDDTAANRLADL